MQRSYGKTKDSVRLIGTGLKLELDADEVFHVDRFRRRRHRNNGWKRGDEIE